MVQALVTRIFNAKDLVDGVVEETANAGAADAADFRLQIKNLPDRATFPIKTGIKPRTMLLKRLSEGADHSQAETSLPRDLLAAGNRCGPRSEIPLFEQIQTQRFRAALRFLPHEVRFE